MRELELLKHVYQFNAHLPPSVTIPPGDDMGAVRIGNEDVLVTVDQVADTVHFHLADAPLEKIGRKALTRNLSDVAAMAALPAGAVVAAALPRGFGEHNADVLFDAMRRTGELYRCPLFGGDISIWDQPLLISVTVLAHGAGVQPILRRGAQVGDVVCVTGHLGGSLEKVTDARGKEYVHHLDFEPRIALARALATDHDLAIHAMIDLSDGLASDLAHICTASEVSAEIWSDRLPISQAAHFAAHRDQRAAWQHALADGEDYELCFTLDAAQADRSLPALIDGVPITRIGVITGDRNGKIAVKMPDGSMQTLAQRGWEHRGTGNPG